MSPPSLVFAREVYCKPKPYAGLNATMDANVPRTPRNFLHEGVALLGGLMATVHRRGVNQTKSETSKSTGSVTPAATEAPEASQGAPVTAHPGRFVCTVSADTGQVGSTTAHDLQLPIAGRNSWKLVTVNRQFLGRWLW